MCVCPELRRLKLLENEKCRSISVNEQVDVSLMSFKIRLMDKENESIPRITKDLVAPFVVIKLPKVMEIRRRSNSSLNNTLHDESR